MNTTTQCNEPAVPHVTLPFDLRDYFAAKAMQGMLAAPENYATTELVSYAYEVAEAMLKAREQ